MSRAVRQLQVLRDKLNIANGAFTLFDLAPSQSFLLQAVFGEGSHREHTFAGFIGGDVKDNGRRIVQKRPAGT